MKFTDKNSGARSPSEAQAPDSTTVPHPKDRPELQHRLMTLRSNVDHQLASLIICSEQFWGDTSTEQRAIMRKVWPIPILICDISTYNSSAPLGIGVGTCIYSALGFSAINRYEKSSYLYIAENHALCMQVLTPTRTEAMV